MTRTEPGGAVDTGGSTFEDFIFEAPAEDLLRLRASADTRD